MMSTHVDRTTKLHYEACMGTSTNMKNVERKKERKRKLERKRIDEAC